MASLIDRTLRGTLTAGYKLVKALRGSRHGAHALPLTPDRRVILVKLRYAPGWRLPGGGRGSDEDLREAVLRELREELGMISHGAVRPVQADANALMIVEDVRYRRPAFSWEVQDVLEASMDRLPANLSPITRRWLTAAAGQI